ncbi:MAG: formate--phosphoribosylaminoimidazolecarboxamide ligase [Candidatus Ranarchaeia archaeon]|jgi:5-formaminoimidazole-4-carboxamide-1-(beta)-D-ribofuranosyl 5'-monophosphate synthetase
MPDHKIATLCSHTALQIFHGAHQEGFKTVGVCKRDREDMYDSFPLVKPEKFILVDDHSELVSDHVQSELERENAVVVPHGSLVEYVGPKNLVENFRIPMFGNKTSLEWESDRRKEREWFLQAGVPVPKEYTLDNMEGICIVKFSGAKGGKGFFIAQSPQQVEERLDYIVKQDLVTKEDIKQITIQEYLVGVRYYPNFFYSPIQNRLEILSIDTRVESNVDELHRMGMTHKELVEFGIFPTYTVTGNLPIVVRESLLPEFMKFGEAMVQKSQELFPKGIIGPFCLETVVSSKLNIKVFEISARIVAGTNLFIQGSPYSSLYFDEPMSTGRRVARELKDALSKNQLDKVVT